MRGSTPRTGRHVTTERAARPRGAAPTHRCKRLKASEQMTTAPIYRGRATEAVQVADVVASLSTLDCVDIGYVRSPIR
ncbi:hypothetical protein EVAR_32480_1 [Eumeta japonica]|uniref:Uncharacterized protein n=1 Tax=Eumeta variegata TaxID=151549 RepID=A0A4C1VKN1_EUMVA|nr:hypothetical protein EVAR_32480_1 [Eumeta japonica]